MLMVSKGNKDPLRVATDLRPVLLRLARELRRETDQLGVTARQATLLALVGGHPNVTTSELAAAEGVSVPSMSRHVDRLAELGLLSRAQSDSDRRRVGLALTPLGQEALDAVRARRTAWLAERLARLEPRECDRIAAAIPLLSRLVPDA